MAEQETDVERTVRMWRSEIGRATKHFDDWKRKSRKIVDRYRDERTEANQNVPRFNILWSNVQTLIPALYAQAPKPVVQRRYLDRDPVGRLASQILQRALAYQIEQGGLHAAMRLAVEDYLLPGRGQLWVRYEAQIAEQVVMGPDGMPMMLGDELATVETIEGETVFCDYIAWEDFLHSPARTWDEVRWVAKRAFMSRQEMKDRFGDAAAGVPLKSGPTAETSDESGTSEFDELNRACVWEIWSKDEKRVYWIADGHHAVLDDREDPMQLQGFFPCPRPAYATTTTNSLVPVPDYHQYQAQAVEVDDLSRRIDGLVASAKLVGVYDQSQPALARLFGGTAETTLIPVENWGQFASTGGLKGAMDFVPLEPTMVALKALYESRQFVKADIYEITGLSDIIRGQAQGAKATATEQRIKGQFATLRLQDRQAEIARLARDTIRIMGELLCEQFQPETLKEMTGAAEMEGMMVPGEPIAGPDGQPMPGEPVFNEDLFQQACALLRDERLRGFRIDIETDSTISVDEQEEKSARIEFLGAVGQFLTSALPAIQMAPQMAPLLGKMLLFGVRGFRAGRELETAVEDMVSTLDQSVQQQAAPQEPPPDPRAEAMRAQTEMKGAAMQQDMQIRAEEHQADMAQRSQRMQLEAIGFQQKQAREAAGAGMVRS